MMMPPEWHAPVVLCTVVAVLAAFLWGALPMELVALGAAAILLIAGILAPDDLLGGFGNAAPVTIGCLFILSAALERTGVIDGLGTRFNSLARGSEPRALALLLLACPAVSAFINNTPIVVVLMPVVLAFCRQSGAKPSRLLIPLSFATILGGTITLAGTSTNLVVVGQMQELGLPRFGLFDIAPLGLLYAVVGCAYLWIFGPRLLPARDTLSTLLEPEHLREYLVQAIVPPGSALIGKPLPENLRKARGIARALEVRRRGVNLEERLEDILLQEGDRLLIRAGTEGIGKLRGASGFNLGLGAESDLEPLEERAAVLMEGIIGPASSLAGRTIAEAGLRRHYGILVLAIHREGLNITRDLGTVRLRFGDTLLLEGPREGVNRLLQERDFIALSEPKIKTFRRERAVWAVGAMLLFVGLGAAGLDTFPAAFLAALLALAAGCLTPQQAYEAVEWRVLLLIVGMLGVGSAMDRSGAAEMLATQLAAFAAPFGPWVLLSATYLLASMLTEFITNTAVATLLTPVVFRLAESAGLSPTPFIVAVMFGASASFATPVGYQTNTYVFGAGGYLFRDFVKIGLPLNLLLWLLASLAIPWFFPF